MPSRGSVVIYILLIVLLIISVSSVATINYVQGIREVKVTAPASEVKISVIPTLMAVSPTPSVALAKIDDSSNKESNLLFYSEYKTLKGLFIFQNYDTSNDPDKGTFMVSGGKSYYNVEFSDLKNVKTIDLGLSYAIQFILGVEINAQETLAYTSIYGPDGHAIYRIDLKSYKADIVWDSENNDSLYSSHGLGGAGELIGVIADKYLLIKIGQCLECGMSKKEISIVNIVDNKEKLVGQVGNVNIDPVSKTFTYQKLQNTDKSCPECYPTEPAGEIFTETLP